MGETWQVDVGADRVLGEQCPPPVTGHHREACSHAADRAAGHILAVDDDIAAVAIQPERPLQHVACPAALEPVQADTLAAPDVDIERLHLIGGEAAERDCGRLIGQHLAAVV